MTCYCTASQHLAVGEALLTDASVRHEQAQLLRRMLDSGLEAILVKIATIGALQECEEGANVADCLQISG